MASSSSSSSAAAEIEEKLIQSGILLSTPPPSTPDLLSLLEKVESELQSIGQGPSVSMRNALEPLRKALSETKLLEHPDDIIQVSVTSCICEIMRISAPVVPYENRKMKEIFHHIIASLEKLDDIHRTCYSKAVRVLEAVAKLELCVMLLGFDYILAVNIFQLFLKTIRLHHSIAVLLYMEDIMTQLIEASDEVSIDFQVSILESLRMKTMVIAPCTSLLAKLVLEKCATRLKPCLLELMKSMNMNFDDHCDVLGRICREVPEGENMVENAGSVPPVEGTSALQLSQVPLLDGTPPTMNNKEPDGSLKTLKRCNQAEQLKDTDAPSDPMQQQMNLSGLSENIRPDKNEKKICVEEPTNKNEQEKKSGSSSDNAGSKEAALPSETGKQSMPDLLAPNSASTVCPSSGSSRKRGRPKKNQTDLNVRKISEGTSSRKRGRPKKNEASPSLTVSIKKEEETTSDAEKSSLQQNDLQNISSRTRHSRKQALSNKKVDNAGSVPSVLQLPQVPLLDGTPPTMSNNDNNEEPDGSLKTSKHCNQAEQVKDTDAPSDPMQQQMNLSGLSENIRPDKGHDCFGMNERKSCVEESTYKKEQEKKSGSSSDNAGLKDSALPSETGKQSMPDLLAPNSANTGCPSSGSSRKRGRPKKNQTDLKVRKIAEGTSSRKRGRPKKNETSPSLTVSKSIKKEEETVSDAEKSSLQRNDLPNISSRTRHSRKQALSNKKDSKKLPIVKYNGEELVGAKLRVWWPLDKMFYEGVISSFDHETKKHKVKYTDDDEEILNLNRECWELLEEDSVEQEPVTNFPPEVSAVDGKKKKEFGASSSKRSGKKTQGSGSTPGENIKSEKAPTEDNSTTDAGSRATTV